jgi:hypothetical protein
MQIRQVWNPVDLQLVDVLWAMWWESYWQICKLLRKMDMDIIERMV